MDIFSENKQYMLVVTIPLTVLVLIASMTYTIRNISRIWNAGKPVTSETKSETVENSDDEEEDANKQSEQETVDSKIDPVQYCEHIQSEVKKARHRVATQEIRQNLTAEDMEKEREIQRKQLEDIFKLMEQNSDKFGASSEEDIRQQMKLYV
ncbi:matrix-remodeling-associated protein 7-like [Mercenaria mercenaria]|uniref:matrix-remodeling-associated protein 7-like n=1 Tax=Mercenaria mercenaria TaxID=6596 RepID=UPI001E1D65C1|nr:matrix-remodeling-associated protein 7-like [Mercenaria mercenaria]